MQEERVPGSQEALRRARGGMSRCYRVTGMLMVFAFKAYLGTSPHEFACYFSFFRGLAAGLWGSKYLVVNPLRLNRGIAFGACVGQRIQSHL